jgi:16S rRNA (cytidine1402-2'-O)-methyltransferase
MGEGRDAGSEGGVPERAAAVLRELLADPLAPGLYVVATPIGHRADITLRALAVLARCATLYCEDTRHSRILLTHYAIRRPLKAYHEHNAERARDQVLAELAAGSGVALISDAGTPLVSDPGVKLVRACLAAGHRVIGLPGPSAVLAGLVGSGLASDAFLFTGFLPARRPQRQARLAELKAIAATLIFFESPARLADSLADMARVLGDRQAAVARELTKLYEEVRRGSLSELARWAAASVPKGEMVLLIAPAAPEAISDATITERLRPLLDSLSLRDAAKTLAEDAGISRKRVYDLGLALKRCGEPERQG